MDLRTGARTRLMASALCITLGALPPPVENDIDIALRALTARVHSDHDAQLVRGVRRFYANRGLAPAWTDSAGWSGRGLQLQRAIAGAATDGLDTGMYRAPTIEARASSRTNAAHAHADVWLSFIALRFAEDLGWGLTVPGQVQRSSAYPRRPFPADSLLTAWSRAADAGQALLEVTPTGVGYVRLREALAMLRRISRTTPWENVTHGPTLRVGATGERVALLRASLTQRGDLASAFGDTSAFDQRLATAVARFQERHGLMADSVFGPVTRAAMNVPITTRIRQVELGMERVRWLPPIDTGWWITVNLADQRAFVLNAGRTIFSTRVVIGTATHKTPMFTGTLTHLVLNPAWNVPPSIAAKEIWPAVQRDASYLERNHMVRVADGIQQRPGPWNALGQIAFMFPNRFNVYMHDTPAKALFDRPDRAYSHGCIRVQRPHEMAELLLARQRWSRAQLDSAIATGERSVVMLHDPIPVRITYATAFMDDDGTLQFRPDVYNRDATLDAHLQRRRAPLAP
jgi:murein L,D-transpeptidase YcbB/YkuD